MISYNGWERDYQKNKEKYIEIFDKAMSQDSEDISFLEKKIADISNRKYAVGVNNATDALYFSLVSHGIKEGDEVLVTDFSFISSSSCISMVGAIPVFCEVDMETYHMSLDSIKRMYTDKTKAIIYTHLFGNMSDTTEILDFCKENNIVFIEDAAQSLGSSLHDIKAGSIGDCSSFSFNSNKVIAGISGGGVFLCDDEDKSNIVKKLRNHGGNSSNFEMLGRNSRLSLLNAEIINFRLDNREKYQTKRQEIAKEYDEVFEDLPLQIQAVKQGLNHNYHKYTIRFEDTDTRKRVRDKLKDSGIKTSIHYEKALSENSMYKHKGHKKDNCKNSIKISQTIMSLPIHPWLTNQEISKISNMIGMLV